MQSKLLVSLFLIAMGVSGVRADSGLETGVDAQLREGITKAREYLHRLGLELHIMNVVSHNDHRSVSCTLVRGRDYQALPMPPLQGERAWRSTINQYEEQRNKQILERAMLSTEMFLPAERWSDFTLR